MPLSKPIPLDGIQPITDWAWAQERTNFVIVGPRPGSPWRVLDATVRGESKSTFSTVRYRLEGEQGRRMRVKQNFNDWWIPTVCDISFRRPGRPLTVGEEVAFLGHDYKRHEGLCFHRHGTQVECSLDAGAMTPEDWSGLMADFDALHPPAVADARSSSFARRNYWNRWDRIEAPWDTREISRLRWYDCKTEVFERIAWATSPAEWAGMPGAPDSVGTGTFEDGDEVQVVFRSAKSLNCSAWLRVQRKPRQPWQPLIDQGEMNRPKWEDVRIGGHAVGRASMDATVGNWYYQWRRGGAAHELHLRARPGLASGKADAVVGAILT